jgi:hypothetical protein
MRRTVLAVFVMVVVCSFSTLGQSVNDAESSALIKQGNAVISLAISADQAMSGLATRVDLLDTNDALRAQSVVRNINLHRGKQAVEFSIPLEQIVNTGTEDIAWYRLRYQIGEASGTIAMSQLLRDLFEMRVIATDQLMAGMTYRVRVRALNPFNGQATAGVKIEAAVELSLKNAAKQRLDLTAAGETNTDGFANLDFGLPPETVFGDDDGKIIITGSKNGIVRKAENDLRTLSGDSQFLIMTDKPIYQPDQMLNIRGILLKGFETKSAISGTELEFRVTDEDDVTLYQEKTKTSEYGVASVSWRIPSNAKLGDYRIRVQNADGDEISGEQIRISRYDLPNFVVEAKTAKPYYVKGENEAEVEVRANYLFGKPVVKGNVRVVEEKSRQWDWEEQKYEIHEGQVKEGQTDAEGKFVAKFDLKDAQDSLEEVDGPKYQDVKFAAYFTDVTTGKT